MIAAICAVNDHVLRITQAAKKYSVPHKTLDDQIKKRVVHGSHPGPSTVLTKEEDALECYLIYTAERKSPLTPTLTKAIGWAIAVQCKKDLGKKRS